MDEFPSNTHKSREQLPRKSSVAPEEPKKRVEKVVETKAIRRKKSPGDRFLELLESGWRYVMSNVLVPAAKDMVADAASQGVEHMLFGEDAHRRRRGSSRNRSRSFTDYGRHSRSHHDDDRPPYPPAERRNRRSRANFEFDDILLATRAEAQEVIERLFDTLSLYDNVSVADLYELVGITSEYTDDKWGWYDLRGSHVRRTRDGYLLQLPSPEPLD